MIAVTNIVYFLPNIGNIINVFSTYINVMRQNRVRSHGQHDESNSKKNENVTSNFISLDDENELLKRKLEAEKARKRTRGPYRKSNVN
ncbi:MAG TPA: hypothetical protein VH481_06170 [Nitrososphaeraceae archaeon]|jgi:hypothetical protein